MMNLQSNKIGMEKSRAEKHQLTILDLDRDPYIKLSYSLNL